MTTQCSSGFSSTIVQAIVALDALFLIFYIVVSIVWFISRVTHLSRKSPLKWYFFGLSLVAIILATLLDLVSQTLSACDVIGVLRSRQISIAATWFYWFNTILLLATIIIPLAGALYKAGFQKSPKIVYIVGGAIIGFITIFILADLGVATSRVNNRRASVYLYSGRTLAALSMVANVFTFLAFLFAAAEIGILCMKVPSHTRRAVILIAAGMMIIGLVGGGILGVVGAASYYRNVFNSDGGIIAYSLFSLLFTALIIISVLIMGESSTLVAASNDGVQGPVTGVPQPVVAGHQPYMGSTQQNPGYQQQYPTNQQMYQQPQQHQPQQHPYSPQSVYSQQSSMPGQSQQLYQVMPTAGNANLYQQHYDPNAPEDHRQIHNNSTSPGMSQPQRYATPQVEAPASPVNNIARP